MDSVGMDTAQPPAARPNPSTRIPKPSSEDITMTRQTLSAVTLETVATASKAAERAVGAYRAGGHRLVAVIQQRVTAPTADRTQPYAPRLAAALRRTGTQAGGLADKGIDAVSNRTEQVIGATAAGVAAQVRRVAQLAEGVDNRVLANGLDAAARVALPGAQAALALTTRLADGAEKLSKAAGVKPARAARKPGRAAATQAKAKPARRAVAPAPTAQAVKAVKAGVAQARKATAKSVRGAKAAVTEAAAPATKAASSAKTTAQRMMRRSAAAVDAATQAVEAAVAA